MRIGIGIGIGQIQRAPAPSNPELVTNPGNPFAVATGWMPGSGTPTVTVASGRLSIAGAIAGARATTPIQTEAGKTYRILSNSDTAGARILVSLNSDGGGQYFTATMELGDNTDDFVASTTGTAYIAAGLSLAATGTVTFGGISVREVL